MGDIPRRRLREPHASLSYGSAFKEMARDTEVKQPKSDAERLSNGEHDQVHMARWRWALTILTVISVAIVILLATNFPCEITGCVVGTH